MSRMLRVLGALAVSLWAAGSAYAQPITTFAGGGVGEQSPALNALLVNPSHLAVDRFNNLHVSDRGGHRILKITPAGTISTVIGTGIPGRLGYAPANTQKISSPSGIAFRPTPFNFDPAVDELIFADTGNHWIAAVDTVTATEPVPYVEMGTSFQGYCCDNFNVFADFDTPQGIAVDAAGSIYIADTNNHIVRRVNWHNYTTPPTIDRVAGIPQQAGSTGDGGDRLLAKLQDPRAVAFDAAGDLYIAESHRIRKVDMATGLVSTLVGGTTPGYNGDGAANASLLLNSPTDLRFGPDGNLYFVDAGNYRVRRIVAGAVQTVAGTGATTDSGDGAAAASAGLAGPRGLAFDDDGHLFVTMYDSGKIRRIEAGTGVITTYAGGAVVQPNGGSFAGDGGLARGIAMNSPGGATPLADGSVYLPDAFNHRVRLVNGATGIVSTIAGNGTASSTGDGLAATSATLDTPVSVAVDASGNRYIAEGNGGRVRRIDPGGTITTFAMLTAPSWVVARGADVYIADGGGNRIVKVTAGVPTTVAGTGAPGSTGDGGPATSATLDFPSSLVFDAAGNFFITEAIGNRVRKVTPGGTISTVAGTGAPGFAGDGGPATAAQLDLPMGIAVDDAGALYIADGNNHRIRKVLPNGTIKTMAGNGTPGFSGDGGDSPGATLNQPSYITRDAAGRLYVADTDNHRIRRINPRIPFAPTLGTLTPGAGSITVAFSPPADDGNAPIVEYGVECHGPTGAGQAGTASPIVVTGLTSGGTYTCFAYARNSAGWGELSATSAPVTVGSAPSITSAAPPSGTLGASYAHAYTASGSPASTFAVTAGSLPPGLTLAPGGALSGTPTTGGLFTGVVTAANGIAPDSTQPFSIAIAKASTTVSLVSGANPSTAGGAVTFTATLTGSAPAPTGMVAFNDGGSPIAGCGAVAIASSEAACTTSSLPIGTRSITAEYGGSADYDAATSNTVSQAVKPLAPAIASPAAGATVAPNPAITGTGTNGASVTVREGVTTLCTTTVNGAGTWSCTTTLGGGGHTIDATQALAGQASAASSSVTFTVVPPVVYNVVLEGWQQSPYVVTPGTGTATATFNPIDNQLTIDLAYSGLGSAETMAHIHGPAARGANAGVLLDLFPPVTSPRTQVVTLTAPQVGMLQAGQLYVNVHTVNFGGGEIRGQIDSLGAATTRALAVATAGAGSGSVSGSTEAGLVISCGADCAETIPDGKPVTLTAAPAAGSTFTGWSGACTGTGNCVVTMDAARSATATFGLAAPNTYTVTPSAGANGTISPSTAQTVSQGGTATFTVTPASGYSAAVGGTCGGNLSGTAYTTNPIVANCTVVATFTLAAAPALSVNPSTLDFGGQSMGTTSPPLVVTVTNTGSAALTVTNVSIDNARFAQANDCTSLAPAATCTINVTFSPAGAAGALNSTAPVAGQLSIASNAAGSPHAVPLGGSAQKSLVSHYYRSILGRAPDGGGATFWASEAARVAALGANVNEVWFALSAAFYFSPEYLALNRTPTQFVTDLYRTFFNREPDSAGLDFWVGQMASGMPREVVLVSYMFSTEFTNFTSALFGNTAARAEVDAVVDFYRGLLARLPDDGGFGFWVGRFRAAQCSGQAAVLAEVEAISSAYALSAEYAARSRTNAQYVGDLYNAFLRRGGDLGGVQFWIDQIATGAQTREQVRVQFRNSAEFQARVAAIIAQGCATP